MHLIWSSRRGRQQACNNDALAVGMSGMQLVCMLVDAAARSAHSQAFAQHWARQTVTQILRSSLVHDSQAIMTLLDRAQNNLRNSFLLEIASYCLLCLDTQSRQARTFHVGDCLAGDIQGESVSWWTSPHTLSRECSTGSRHVLTRSLNAKRFAEPDITVQPVPAGKTLILATDGYWADYLLEGHPLGETPDDASYLILKEGAWIFDCFSDTNNSLVMIEPN